MSHDAGAGDAVVGQHSFSGYTDVGRTALWAGFAVQVRE
jgi:hypothetical protein